MSAQTNTPDPEVRSEAAPAWEHRPGSPGERLPPPEHPSDALREAMSKFAELKEFTAYYVAARMDALKATVRNLGIYAGIGLIALAAGGALVATASVLMLLGISGAFAALLNGNLWLGAIITSVLVFLLVGAGVAIGMVVLTKTFKSSTVKKYEERQREQRLEFGGRDVGSEAAAAQHITGKA